MCQLFSTAYAAKTHLDDLHLGRGDPLEDELGDAVACLDLEVGIAQVEEEDAQHAPVVGVNHTGTNVDAVLCGCSEDAGAEERGACQSVSAVSQSTPERRGTTDAPRPDRGATRP